VVPFVYAGAAILTPAFFAGVGAGPSSMSPLFDRAAKSGRLYGLRLEGVWMHVGSPDAVAAAEAALASAA
jgi:MurNAc alpha-1-phosphate uridylyltransferase